jgi:hypothetical protein
MRLALGLWVLSPGRAEAQVTGVMLDPIVIHSVARTGFRTNDTINAADCVDDDVLTFNMTATGNQNTDVEIWAGTDCELLVNRTTTAETLCWKLFSAPVRNGTMTAYLHARDILAGRTLNVPGSNTPAAPVGTIVNGVGLEACDPRNLVSSAAFEIQLFFMLVDGNASVVGNLAKWTARAKIAGPPPPQQMNVESGSESLLAWFRYVNNQSNDVTSDGYTFFCDPPPSSAAAAATAAPDAQPLCDDSKTALVAGSTADPKYRCATAPISATEAEIANLQASTPYHVAMAVSDTYGNLGPLSPVACGVPRTKDVEVSACSVSRRRAPHGVGLSAAALAFWSLRFARRRARAPSGAASRRA